MVAYVYHQSESAKTDITGSRVPTSGDEIKTFFRSHLPRQIERYKPILEKVSFDEIYWGGGTPTIAGADTMQKIYTQIPRLKDIPLRTTEVSPYTITDDHIDLFHEYGFVYVSMGIQTLDKRVLEKENRFVVNRQKINHICRRLDKYDIISNVDLIFFLDTGGTEDLEITGNDMEIMMSSIRPVSITLYTNYRVPKSMERRKCTIRLIKEMLEKYPEYRCVNSLLEDADVEYDMTNSVEYRLMRGHCDFNFYMLQKVPQIHIFGHNMMSVGEYGGIKPRYNYYYLFDFIDKYQWKDCYTRANDLNLEFERTREKLDLPHHNFTQNQQFFVDETGKENFKRILKQAGYPYHQF